MGAAYLVWAAVGTTWLLGLVGMAQPQFFSGGVTVCYLIGIAGCLGAFAPIPVFLEKEIESRQLLITIFLQGLALVVLFASIYRGYGFPNAADHLYVTDAVYFSAVTWTTLGYGDLTPPRDLRLLAALEALVGYIFLGLGIGLGVNVLSRRQEP